MCGTSDRDERAQSSWVRSCRGVYLVVQGKESVFYLKYDRKALRL